MDSWYRFLTLGTPLTQSMKSREVNAVTRLAEASWWRDKVSSSYLNTRSVGNMNFTIPYIKSCQDQTFYYNAIKDWNALPSCIKQLNNKYSFKTNVNNILWIVLDNTRKVLMCAYNYFKSQSARKPCKNHAKFKKSSRWMVSTIQADIYFQYLKTNWN